MTFLDLQHLDLQQLTKPSPKIHHPPGFKLLAFAEFWFSPKTLGAVLEPAVLDLRGSISKLSRKDALGRRGGYGSGARTPSGRPSCGWCLAPS